MRADKPSHGANEVRGSRWSFLIYVVLALGTLAVYWPTLHFDFVNYDDGDYVMANAHVKAGINKESVVWAFKTVHASNWHPLTWLSHELDTDIYGPRPGGAHLTNVLLHVANTLLLFGVMRAMTGAMWRSAVVAALFAWHPTHVESVAWISERKDVLSALFWLLTMGAYVKSTNAQCPRPRLYYGAALVCFALGLMAKPMLVTLPFVLLLMDYWPLGRISDFGFLIADREGKRFKQVPLKRAVAEKMPFLILAAVSCVVTFVAQQKGGAVATLNGMPSWPRLANALVSYLRYMGKVFWPAHLSVMYPMPPSWPMGWVAASAVFLAGMSGLALWQAKRRPYLFAGWFWFAGTLVPVIGLVQVGVQSMADRYLYVPGIGWFIIVAWAGGELAGAWPRVRGLLTIAAGVALAGCWAVSVQQVQYWRNGETLFRRAVAVTSGNYLANNNLGFFLENHGKLQEAEKFYRKSVEINPNYEEAQNNLGHILTVEGKCEEAIMHLREALRIKPGLVEAHNNLGNALGDMGKRDEAIKEYEAALRYKSDDLDAHNNLGVARAIQGRLDEAEALLREAVRIKPTDPGAHSNLGNVLALRHKLDEAMAEYQAALRLNPEDAQAHYNLGNVLLEKGKLSEASEQYGTAIRIRAQNPDAYYKLGLIAVAQGKRQEAMGHFQEALRLDPKRADAQQRISELQQGK